MKGLWNTHVKMVKRDLFLSAPCANSLISITIRTYRHTNVTSETIIYPKPNPKKKFKVGARNPYPFLLAADRPPFGRSSAC